MDSCRIKLEQGLKQMALPADEVRIEALLAFVRLIEKWNKTYNLTAIRNAEEMVGIHILDSLAVLPHLQAGRIADVGTGAGLPGIPLAIWMPESRFVLLDSNAKKTRFVQQAVLELRLKNVEIVQSRVELYRPQQLFSCVITRAFAEISEILDLTAHLLAEDGLVLAMKGQHPQQELRPVTYDYTVIPLIVPEISAERCLIKLKGTKHG